MERFLKEERWFCGFAGVKRRACFVFSDMMQCGESLVKEACRDAAEKYVADRTLAAAE
jgi:hypothetical protein